MRNNLEEEEEKSLFLINTNIFGNAKYIKWLKESVIL